ncbi:mitochondrial carrier protein, putative [Ichthyophthirius multifiliis]|uniref:Mitochondrial carrier protein, putative n=1 Tax=Ichthyophthirius multifiliis TaxID=5932 RepID=G0QJE0_ICHMU|nr:mitochondrial carrier protein, putative [Ichthyophthirius multifiliis]EGR34665.1 mitochondrial carrier protein, putative [Ichthyophthirius multifiliis]|eukprot:XP_004039969.1 mitochondrial carrier protein, putative [Ichthyophthirius multifiliis]
MTSPQYKHQTTFYLSQYCFLYQYRDYIAGCFGGFAQALIGQPFDTIKVRLQSSLIKINAAETIKNLIKNEGPLALYKGVGSPLICMSGVVSIQFGVFQNTINTFQKIQEIKNLPIYQTAICGAISGAVACIVLAPMEHIRIRLQVMKDSNNKSAISAFSNIFKQYGIKGVYKGFFITLMRETPAMFIYFGIYTKLLRDITQKYSENQVLVSLSPLFAGAFAGIGYWSFTYPIDTIKSKIQTDNFVGGKYKGTIDCFRQTINQQGTAQLFKGFGVANMRAVPVNAASFFLYENVKKTIESHTQY